MSAQSLPEIILGANADEAWPQIFDVLTDVCVRSASELDNDIEQGDRLLADSGWDLWQAYGQYAPSAVASLLNWWEGPRTGAGRAVLVLDALSARELGPFFAAAADHGAEITLAQLLGAPIPTDTNAFAQALGLSQRSQLKASKYPKQWPLASSGSLYSDVTDMEFSIVASDVPPTKDVFIWHSWLDDVIHNNADKPAAPKHISTVVKQVFSSDSFWQLVTALREGRDLVITSDHGYAISQRFADLPASLGDEVRKAFGAKRYGDVPAAALEFADRRPFLIENHSRAAVVGPWKWKVQGGFPHVTHGGVSLGEVCVPYILLPAIAR